MNLTGNGPAEATVPPTSTAESSAPGGPDDPRVIAALEEYQAALKAGRAPDRAAFQARHPEIATVLAECLDGLEWMQGPPPGQPGDGCGCAVSAPAGAGVGPGTPLGDYWLLREIGRGGMGVVYEAEQLSLGRRVAVKVLPFAAALDAKQLQRFKHEAQAAAQLHHTNIVPVYGVGCEHGVHFYAMQFIKAQTLAALIAELRQQAGSPDLQDTALYPPEAAQTRAEDTTPGPAKPAPAERALQAPGFFRRVARLGIQTAEALEHAHQLGIIHRDIKPGNLLVEMASPLPPVDRGVEAEGLRLWITDFGLCQCLKQAALTLSGDLLGTLRYMSPEQALARRTVVDHRTDIYSLGVTLYELLTLEPAFPGSDRADLLRQIAFEEPQAPRRLNRAIPKELETIVLKAMDKDPAQRYATAQELANDLERFLKDEPIRARRPTLWQRLAKCARRHRGTAWMGVVLLVVLAVGSALSTVLIARQLSRAERAEADRATELRRALRAEGEATHNLEQSRRALWQAKLAQAQAGRRSGRAGQRFASLEALREAAQLARSLGLGEADLLKLRNEAIACLALPDVRVERTLLKNITGQMPHAYWIAFDPLFRHFAYSDRQGNLSIRRVRDGKETARLAGLDEPPRWVGLAFSPDGRWLRVDYPYSDRPPLAAVWEVRDGKPVRQVVLQHACDFSPDSRFLAGTRPDGAIGVYEIASGREVKRLAREGVEYAKFHPDGRQLAAVCVKSDPHALLVLDLETGKQVARYEYPQTLTDGVAWRGDGRLLAAPCTDQRIYVWDHARKRLQAVLEGHTSLGIQIKFSHTGEFLISTSWDGSTRFWDPVSGRQLVHVPRSHFVAIRQDGRQVALLRDRSLELWEVAGGQECRTLHHGLIGNRTDRPGDWGPRSLDFSPDGRLLVSGSLDGTRLWDLATFTEVGHLPAKGMTSVLFHPDGESLFAYGPGGLHRWPIRRQTRRTADQPGGIRVLQVGPPQVLDVPGNSIGAGMSLDRRGRWLAAVEYPRGRAIALDLEHPGNKLVLEHPGMSGCILSPDGRWVATWGTLKGKVTTKVWDTADGKPVPWNPPAGECADFFTPDNRWLVTHPPGPARLRYWRLGSWEPGSTLPNHGRRYLGAAPSPDGTLLFWVCRGDQPRKLIHAGTGKELATLEPPLDAGSTGIRFSPDSTRLAVATGNHTIHVWNLRALRRRLAEFGLDWDLPAYPPAARAGDARPIRVEVRSAKPTPQ